MTSALELQVPDHHANARLHQRLRVLHVISGLGPGGAESVLFKLATRSDAIDHEVICLGPREWYSDKLEERGIRVHHVDMSSAAAALQGMFRLYWLIKSNPADLVQCWMYRGNVFGGLSSRMAGKPVLWNIRCSDIHLYPRHTRSLARLGGYLARWVPDIVINCSAGSKQQHARIGYDAAPGIVIPNGYDPTIFYPDETARAATHEAIGADRETFLIGSIGRWDTQKGYPTLLRAMKILTGRGVRLRLLLIGRGLDPSNLELAKMIEDCGCRDLVFPLGYRADIAEITRAFDLHVLASRTEGFPNVIAETMLSATPNVATNVGDSRLIIGETGWLISAGDPDQLADAIEDAHCEWVQKPALWAARRERARRRIAENFSLDRMFDAYEQAWRQVANKSGLIRP